MMLRTAIYWETLREWKDINKELMDPVYSDFDKQWEEAGGKASDWAFIGAQPTDFGYITAYEKGRTNDAQTVFSVFSLILFSLLL